MHKIIVMGLGYIGLPTAIIAAKAGFEVIGVDIKEEILEKTNRGELHFIEPGLNDLCKEVISSGTLKVQKAPEEGDLFLIVVPTPFKGNNEPDTSFVEQAALSIIPHLRKGNILIIESTSPVGTTERIAQLIFSKRPELKESLYIAYCPERVLPGNIVYELEHNDRVIGGITPESSDKARKFYEKFVTGELYLTNAKTAELCKLTENASRDVQIAFANELSIICDKADINVWELIELANRHPRVNILRPGCGVGGHCIAVDPYFITSEFPLESQFINKARQVNNHKAFWTAEKILSEVKRFELEHKRKAKIALLGLTFKPDIDDLRESPALWITQRVIQKLNGENEVFISEPNIANHKLYKLTDYQEAYQKADIAAFLQNHSVFRTLEISSEKINLDFCGVCR